MPVLNNAHRRENALSTRVARRRLRDATPRRFIGVCLPMALSALVVGCMTETQLPRATSIVITPGSATLDFLGQSAVFTASIKDQWGNDFTGSVAWTSSAPAVFTVNSDGVATAVSNGSGTVRAELDGISGTASVIVHQVPTALDRIAGDTQRGRPGTILAESLVARVLDAGDSPVPGAAVSFLPANGSGSATPGIVQADMAGEAQTSWTLGDAFGLHSLVAAVVDGPNTVFTATALRPNELADGLEVVSGNDQSAPPGEPLHRPIVIRVLDEHDRPVEGATVVFGAPQGHGLADPDSTGSDGTGEAATTWTLGDKVGVQLLTASVPGGPSTRIVATGSVGVCNRTPQVLDALVSATGVNGCAEVTNAALSQIGELDLQELGIARLAADDFAGLSGLESLLLRRNRLGELPHGVFYGLSSLERLDLYDNQLTGLSARAFDGLSNLKSLDLGLNQFADLPTTVFSGLSSLESLGLVAIRLTDLPLGVFAGLANLQHLSLSENRFEELPSGLFTGLTNLKHLSLGSNPRLKLSAGIFDGLSSLEYLYLARSGLSDLPTGVFAGLANLDYLYLDRNSLTDLTPGVFAELSNLRYLYLWGNQLSLSPGIFTGLSNLEYLDLYHNQLKDLPSGSFTGLSNLPVLDLGGNQLNLRTGAFAELPNLEYLKLYENQLTSLPSGVFAGLSNLERLDLGLSNESDIPGGNELKELPSGLFAGLDWLRAVWLNGNPGSPFSLVLRMERTDTTDLTAPGPAKVVVAVETGAPFDIRVRLSAPGATLSPTWATIRTGGTHSNVVTVTANTGTGSVTITLDELPTVPQTHCEFGRRFAQGRGHWGGGIACYKGILVKNGGPLRLFR